MCSSFLINFPVLWFTNLTSSLSNEVLVASFRNIQKRFIASISNMAGKMLESEKEGGHRMGLGQGVMDEKGRDVIGAYAVGGGRRATCVE